MKSKLLLATLVAACAMAPALGYSAEDGDKDRTSPKAFVKDSVITTKIKAQLAAKKLSSVVHIKVDTDDKGFVVLSGNARTTTEVNQAVSIARAVEGVKGVDNRIQVKADL